MEGEEGGERGGERGGRERDSNSHINLCAHVLSIHITCRLHTGELHSIITSSGVPQGAQKVLNFFLAHGGDYADGGLRVGSYDVTVRLTRFGLFVYLRHGGKGREERRGEGEGGGLDH